MRAIAKEAVRWLATAALIMAVSVLWPGCASGNGSSVAVTVNFFGSLSRFGQSLGGTDTTIKGQIEGGGNAAATVPLTP
jgi:predicted anti-sigma-YlaC factor YlaD